MGSRAQQKKVLQLQRQGCSNKNRREEVLWKRVIECRRKRCGEGMHCTYSTLERRAATAADVDGVIGQLRQELVALGAAHHPYLLLLLRRRRRWLRALRRGAGAVLHTLHAQCRRGGSGGPPELSTTDGILARSRRVSLTAPTAATDAHNAVGGMESREREAAAR